MMTALAVAALAAVPIGWQWKTIQSLKAQLAQAVPKQDLVIQTQRVSELTHALEQTQAQLADAQRETAEATAVTSTDEEPLPANPMAGMAQMFEDPNMRGILRQQMEGQIKAMFGDLLESFELTEDDRAAIESLLVEKMMLSATQGLKAMNQNLSKEERQAFAAEFKDQTTAFDDEIRETYGDEIADKISLYEKSTNERQELAGFRSALDQKGVALDSETEETLMGIMYEERQQFPFTHDMNDPNNADVLASLNDTSVATMEEELTQLADRINVRVADVLDPEALDAFKANQESFRALMISSLKMGQQMMGGSR